MAMSQSRVMEEASVKVQVMAIGTAKDQAAELARLLSSAEAIIDPSKGSFLDLYM